MRRNHQQWTPEKALAAHPISSFPSVALARLIRRFEYSSSIAALDTSVSPSAKPLLALTSSPLLPEVSEFIGRASSPAHAREQNIHAGITHAPERVTKVP